MRWLKIPPGSILYLAPSAFSVRPKGLGKSLLVSTLSELFAGNRELFEGRWIEQSDYQWETYPIIRIDFSRKPVKSADELKINIKKFISRIALQNQVTIDEGEYDDQFYDLIFNLSTKGQVVILIDEYDKPIIDNITNIAEARGTTPCNGSEFGKCVTHHHQGDG